MARIFIFRMDTVSVNKKGFTLMEMMVALFVASSLTIVTLSRFDEPNVDHYYFMSRMALEQSKAILNKEKVYLEHNISFNGMGHVEVPRTIAFGRHKVIVHLGSGYATWE